ncbi:MAG: glutamate--tRNA ligase [Bacteroidota bacterium]
MGKKVRVRFAPSPTGPLHMGGVRTALYNYLFAKKHGGDFILRVEDTDQNRFVAGAEDYIVESLKWCGISPDEGQSVGGDYGPYRQSERKELYKNYALELINSGNAYYAFDTSEELDALRNQYEAEKKVFTYNAEVRGNLNNSLALSQDEVNKKIEEGEQYVIRFKMPENEILELKDIIRGDMKVNTSALDDKILFKSDGMPTYHLANIVDDHLMEISHVIRGEEWLPSMALHVMLYKAFGWEIPEFAHLPLLLKPTGKGKLSKRDGDKMGFPVFPLEWKTEESTSMGYREEGYFPEAFVNMLALLGWNPGTEKEIYTLEELVNDFSLEKVGKSGSRFDPEKAKWFNQQWMKLKTDEEIAELFQKELQAKGIVEEGLFVKDVVGLVKERATFVSDLWEQSSFFFEAPTEYDAKVIKKRWKGEMNQNIADIRTVLDNLDTFNRDSAHDAVMALVEEKEWNMGQVMNSLRLCMVGAGKGPDLFTIIEWVGKAETLARLQKGVDEIVR